MSLGVVAGKTGYSVYVAGSYAAHYLGTDWYDRNRMC